MFSLSESANWPDDWCAAHIAEVAAGFEGADGALGMAIYDVWVASAGNLHRFATRLIHDDTEATRLLHAAVSATGVTA